MKALILGKERALSPGEPGENIYYLTNPADMSETGIYSGQTIENWGDEAYLNRIRAHKPLTFAKEKPFTIQTAEKTDPDIRILRKSNYGRQPIPEIVKNLTAIAESKCINQPAPREASLWNAIDILEDIDQKERNLK